MGMRVEKLELSIYDDMMAEIIAEHMAEKSLMRKHWEGKMYRHRKPENRHSKQERNSMFYQGVECGNSTARNFHAEKSIRADFVLEQMEAEIDAALEVAERRSYFRNLNEWLRWA